MAKLRQVIFKAACFYSVASLVYVSLVALMVDGSTTIANAYSLVLGNLVVLFGYSLVFGASFLLFDAAKLPQSARRLLHVIVLYVATVAACFMLANVTDDLRSRILFVFMATFAFIVVYTLGAVIGWAVRRRA